MESKAAFIFLTICFISMIDSGSNLRFYQDCELSDKRCERNDTVTHCFDKIKNCVRFLVDGNVYDRQCFTDTYIDRCNNNSNSHLCQKDYCNGP